MFDEAQMAETMRQAGAEIYLVKTAPSEQLLAAIRGSVIQLVTTSHACSSELRRGQALLDGVFRELCDRVDLQLVHDPQPMRLDGLVADVQPQGNVLDGSALGQKLQDFALPRRQQRERRRLGRLLRAGRTPPRRYC